MDTLHCIAICVIILVKQAKQWFHDSIICYVNAIHTLPATRCDNRANVDAADRIASVGVANAARPKTRREAIRMMREREGMSSQLLR